MPSLRDKVEQAVTDRAVELLRPHGCTDVTAAAVARRLTEEVFRTMADQRPCVTCGKGLGPAKVAKGYVQCYDCVRLHRPAP